MEQDVLGFDVAVDHALPVGVVQRVGDGGGDAYSLIDAELGLAIELVPQRLAVDERHHIVKERICLPRVEQRQDVGMLEIGGGRDLLEKPLGAEDRRELRSKDLDRDFPLVPEVFGEVDSRHAALAEVALELVAVGEGCGEPGGDLGHGWLR